MKHQPRTTRRRLATAAVAAVTVLPLPAALSTAQAAADVYFKYPENRLSPQFKKGTCVYRIRYGNYGDTGYAQVRFYSGNCGDRSFVMVCGSTPGAAYECRTEHRITTGGSDTCGSYFEKQATLPARSNARTMGVNFPEVNDTNWFQADSGQATTAYRNC
ncbi:hypothetical protein ACFVH6_05015 [Spirillospora sp. NPDC127200]